MDETLLTPTEADIPRCRALLREWIGRLLDAESLAWVEEQAEGIAGGQKRTLFLSFGLVPRKVGKADLQLTAADIEAANGVRPRWDPSQWSVDQAVRVLFVLSFPSKNLEQYVEALDQLFAAGEVGELVSLYQALPLLPYQPAHVLRAAEGIRTNMKPVFCAVAHRNPYPAEQLDEGRWNQMVLKCLFIEAPISPVFGLDERGNVTLMRMLLDYAHERWAAGRSVSPELWRPVGPFADKAALNDLQQVLEKKNEAERQAAALALSACLREPAKELLQTVPDLAQQIKSGELTWDSIGA